ncbi:MAG: hypothetical protein IV112_02510 [Methyloversatilis discipulorum]|uniref:hypothetical protein n=1 Tax=Methyloversatilis discipulorum TaxID=1119528 RepID=UPI0026F21858|nr:hypothetical protein [Methyloversatilis discipulorum]MBT9515535.1 hypothetical protein [Methyloversatilis discipulorum]
MASYLEAAGAIALPLWNAAFAWITGPEVVISLCALSFTAYQAHLQRAHNRLSVSPSLAVFSEESADPEYPGAVRVRLLLQNNGLGPAVLDSLALIIGAKKIRLRDHNHFRRVVKEALGRLYCTDRWLATYGGGHAIKAGDAVLLADFTLSLDPPVSGGEVQALFDWMGLEVHYRCMYGKRGRYNTHEHRSRVTGVQVPSGLATP